MTIKQQGGIFGRNPTFNDVDVDGTLTASDANISGTLTSDGLAVDTDTLYVNAAANRVGINTVTPSSELHIETTGTTGLRLIGGPVGVTTLYMGDTDNNLEGYLQYSNTADYMRIATAGAERFRIHSDGDVEVKTGNLVIGTSGQGIDFSATSGTGTSELFDDYEEGSFTVVFADDPVGGNSVNGGYGQYTKVGNLVTISFAIVNMNTSGLTGGNNLYFRGLPYTAANVSGPGMFVGATNVSNVTSTGQPTACLVEGGTWGYFRDTAGNILVSDVSSGTGDLYVTLTYEAV